jgi:hypothetical protein
VPCTIIRRTTGQLDKSIQYEYTDPSGFIKKNYDLTSTDSNLQYAACYTTLIGTEWNDFLYSFNSILLN